MATVAWEKIESPEAAVLRPQLCHLPELDGVRGLAILLVLICHFGYLFPGRLRDWLSLGWAGVDLFFVLSGFLITRILLAWRGSPGYFRLFYTRRVLRIFPIYFLFVGAYFLLMLPLAHYFGLALERTTRDQWWYWLYLANWHTGANHSTLVHLWSLGIEEQFYLVWPVVVLLYERKRLGALCVGIALLSSSLRLGVILGAGFGREATLFTVCRMEGVALGAMIACGVKLERAKAFSLISILVIATSLASGGPNGLGMSTLGISAVSVLGAIFLQEVQKAEGVSKKLALVPLLRSFGKYSYAIYVFHIPVLTLLVEVARRISFTGDALILFVFGVAASYGLGWLSWRALERPIVGLKTQLAEVRA